MIWRATGRLGHVSWARLTALQPRGLSLTGGACHPLGLPAKSSLSPWGTAPAVFGVGTPANGLLKGLGSLVELLVLFCEEGSVGDTTKRMKALMCECFFF